MRSHRSRNSGAGGLWLQRRAFTPKSLNICSLRSMDLRGSAVPSEASSWWRQNPFSLICCPLRMNPLSGVNLQVLMPNVVL